MEAARRPRTGKIRVLLKTSNSLRRNINFNKSWEKAQTELSENAEKEAQGKNSQSNRSDLKKKISQASNPISSS
jgi:hypothetical protein